jgi:hypothetical protein
MSKASKGVMLPETDRLRMSRLMEEVYARASEMALILGRH